MLWEDPSWSKQSEGGPKKQKIQYVFSGNEKTVKNNTSQKQHLDAKKQKKQSVFASHEKTVKTYLTTSTPPKVAEICLVKGVVAYIKH